MGNIFELLKENADMPGIESDYSFTNTQFSIPAFMNFIVYTLITEMQRFDIAHPQLLSKLSLADDI